MASVEVPNTPQCKLAHAWLKATAGRDIDGFMGTLHKDFHQYFYPRSLGRPRLSKEECFQEFTQLVDFWAEDAKVSYPACYLGPLPLLSLDYSRR